MRKRILSLILSVAMLLSFMPNFAFAQQAQDQGKALKSEIIEGKDGKAYTAYHLDGYTVADILGYGPRQRMAGEEIPGFTLQLNWVGRTLEEFPFPEGGIELRLTPKSDAKKVIATITYTKDDIYSKIVTDPDGTVHYVGRAKGLKPFKKTEDFTQALLDEGVDMQIPYGISFHPELFATSGGTQTFILTLQQKSNPLWTTEWNVSDKYKDEDQKPDIMAFYRDNGAPVSSVFYLPKNNNVYSMEADAPKNLYWDGTGTINIWDKSDNRLHPVVVGDNANDGFGRDYTGKLSRQALLLVSDAANPRPFIGFGQNSRKPDTKGFYQKDANSPKFLLNTYPTPEQINTPSVKVLNKVTGKEEPAYRQIKRYAVYEALNVKFNTGEGKLAADGDKNVDIGQPQEIGYSEKIAGNESGRKITLPTDKLIPPEKPASQKTDNKFIGWALSKDATTPLFKTQEEANKYAEAFTKDTTFYAIYAPETEGKVAIQYVDKEGNAINDKYKIKGEEDKYPAFAEGNKGEAVDASKVPEPTFIGYKRTADPIEVTGKTYKTEQIETVEVKYEKLPDIIPEKKNGQDNPDATPEVKKHYAKVTFQVAPADADKAKLQLGGTDATSPLVYYVNPLEGKKIKDVADVKALSKDDNLYKVDPNDMWKFTPDTINSTDQEIMQARDDQDNVVKTEITLTAKVADRDAKKYGDKLEAQDIVKWVGDQVEWKDGVKPIEGATFKNVEDLSNRSTDNAGVFSGKLKVTFGDDSTKEIDKQKLIVRAKKDDKKKPEGDDPGTYPEDARNVKFVAGEGIEALNPANKEMVLQKDEALEEADYPAVTVKENYKEKANKLAYYDVQPGKLTAKDTTITASTAVKGQGSAAVVYKAGDTDITAKVPNLKLDGQTYPANNKLTGTEDTAIDMSKITQPELIGYEKVNITTEPATDAKYTEAGTAKVIFNYKKIDDIIKEEPGKTKPAGYVTVAFKKATGAVLDPSEMSYFVNPKADVKAKVSKVGDNYQISGKKADGTDLTGNVPAVKSTDANKYEIKYADGEAKKWGYDNFDKVDKDITADTTFTAQVITFGKPTVTFPNVEIEKGGSKVVTPEVRDKQGKKIAQPGKPEVNEKPDGVTVTPNDDGTVKIEVPKNYKGNGSFTIKVTYKVDGKDVPGVINVKIVEDNPVEPKNYDGYINLEPVGEQEAKHATDIHVIYLYGYQDKTVHPQGDMTRAEAAAMVARLKNLDMSDTSKPDFKDVESRWYNSAINAVVKAGLMKGYPDGTFAPNGKITRAEFAQLIKGIDNPNTAELPFTDVAGHWGLDAISQAYANKRIMGYPDNTFKPNNDITRAEAVTILNSLFDRGINEAGLANVRKDIVEFKDLDRSHWAYYQIVEASNTHEFYRAKDGEVPEVWVRVLKTWNDFLK